LSQNSKESWNPHSIPRFTIDQSPHFSIEKTHVLRLGWAELNLSRGPDISSDALNAVFRAHVIDLPILDGPTVRSVTGLGKPGLTNEKRTKTRGLPVNFCHQFDVVRNTTPGKMS